MSLSNEEVDRIQEFERIAALESQQRNAEREAQTGNPAFQAREAGKAAMAGHFKKVDEAMEAVNRLEPILARAVLAEIACSYPEDVLKVAREVEQEAQGPRCPNAIAREQEVPPFKAVFDEAFVAWLAHYGSSTLIRVADVLTVSVEREYRAYRRELETGEPLLTPLQIDAIAARAGGGE